MPGIELKSSLSKIPPQVEERDGFHYSLESGHKVEWQKEENWMFRLSRHKPAILQWLRNTQPIKPRQFAPQATYSLDNICI